MNGIETTDLSGQPSLPLSGIRVIDFTQVMMGPVCTQMLGDYGADVIKIERAGAGDLSRSTFPPQDGIDNPVFCSLNRHKRSVALDLRDAAQMAAVKDLIAGADVVVNNFRAGVMDRMGLGYEDCARLNPRIIYAVGTGFGETGPYAHKGGQDVLAQAMSGAMARKADPSHPLATYPTALADYSAGMHMVQGILMALLHRVRTGVGQKISVSLYNSMLAMQMQEAAMILMRDTEVNWAAMPLSGVFETADAPLVLVGAFKANPLRDICAALQLPDLSLDPRFTNLEQQFKHKAELQRQFRERFKTQGREHWLQRLEAQDLLCAPVRDMREVLVDPQTLHNGMVMQGSTPETAPYRFIASPIAMSAAPTGLRRAPPRLGEHTDEVLAEAAAAKAGAKAKAAAKAGLK
jgi:formyl-CoA transferase